jgi:hypothetical protein
MNTRLGKKTIIDTGEKLIIYGGVRFNRFQGVSFNILHFIHNVTYRPIARQRLAKHIPTGANMCNNMTSIARQRISKYA